MQEIPKPQLLDPDRVDRDEREEMTADDHSSRAQLFAVALEETCEYADQLWTQVNALRGYLLDALAPDPRLPGVHTRISASPIGPDDETGWQKWIEAYATTNSVLCGAHGDSGFGLSEAREQAQVRRSAPELNLHVRHPATTAEAPPKSSEPAEQPKRAPSWSPLKVAGAAIITVLTLRGLRPSPGRSR